MGLGFFHAIRRAFNQNSWRRRTDSRDDRSRCPRCQKFFTTGNWGVKVHLQKKSNVRCHAWYHSHQARDRDETDSFETDSISSSSSEDVPSQPPRTFFEDVDDAANEAMFAPDEMTATDEIEVPAMEFTEEELHPRVEPRTHDNHTVKHPTAGAAFGPGLTVLEEIRLNDKFAQERNDNTFYPFVSEMEWEVASWLSRLKAPMSMIDEFFRLDYVKSHNTTLSFGSAKTLRSRIELLPSPPAWKSIPVTVPGGTSKDEITFFYRDGYECLKYLFGNPLFLDHFEVAPAKVFANDSPEASRIYSEMMTGEWANAVQDAVSPGETLALVLLGSDKTHLTNTQGDKECHAVYMSCGNIDKAIRTKASSHAWLMIAQIPIVKFQEEKFQGLLSMRLYHTCMEIACRNLMKHSHSPGFLPDPSGTMRYTRPLLAGYLADLPEKLMAGGLAHSQSPISEASTKQFGDPFAHNVRHGFDTCAKLKELLMQRDPLQLGAFERASKAVGLNGVNFLFWEDWKFADPGYCLLPDALHDWHKFLMMHPVLWIRMLLGDDELDKRFSVIQRRVGFRHFRNGFTRFRQHTGREQRDIARILLVCCSDHPSFTPPVMDAIRGLISFMYYAQYESHSEETLGYLAAALKLFHDNKEALSQTGVRDGPRRRGLYNIPKLELMANAERMVRLHGSLQQYSGDQTEHLHIANAKDPYKHTNRKDFAPQMCRYLDRLEKIWLFTMYLAWITDLKRTEALAAAERAVDHERDRMDVDSESEEVSDLDSLPDEDIGEEEEAAATAAAGDIVGNEDPQRASLRLEQFARLSTKFLRGGVRDFFAHGSYPQNDTTAFILKRKPDAAGIAVENIADLYGLPDLRRVFNDFYSGYSRSAAHSEGELPFLTLEIWSYMRLQMRVLQDFNMVYPPQTVMALPPSVDKKNPLGFCNFVLVKSSAEIGPFAAQRAQEFTGIVGASDTDHFVAQVRAIFKPIYMDSGRQSEYLAYVQPFNGSSAEVSRERDGHRKQVPVKHLDMYKVVRSLRTDGSRRGLIIRLTDIWRPVEVVPRFGKKCPSNWTAENSVELAKEFYVNNFSDKETFQNIY